MATDVVMPQMGESIAEGTIVRWIKKVGDAVDRDEPLFEISTDKVDAEIPSPAAGIVTEIRAKEGETVAVNSVVAVIASDRAATQPASRPAAVSPPPALSPGPVGAPPRPSVSLAASSQGDGTSVAASQPPRAAGVPVSRAEPGQVAREH